MKTLFLSFLLFLNIHAKAIHPPTEAEKIQMLITYVEQLKDAKFIRNGDEHTAKEAAKFFRKKLDRKEKEVKTARDFIAKCASVSTTSGKPYEIKFANGKILTTAEALTKELERIEKTKK
jgi:hypothetical protein